MSGCERFALMLKSVLKLLIHFPCFSLKLVIEIFPSMFNATRLQLLFAFFKKLSSFYAIAYFMNCSHVQSEKKPTPLFISIQIIVQK